MNYKIVIYVLNHQIYMSMCTFFLCCLLPWGHGRQTEVLRVALRRGDDNFTIDQQFADKSGNIFEGNTHTSYSKLIYWHVFPILEASTFQNRGQIYHRISISPFRLWIQNPGQALSLKRKVCIGPRGCWNWAIPQDPNSSRRLRNSIFFQSCQTAICWQRERACWPVIFAIFAHIFDGLISKLPDGNLVLLWKTTNFKSVNHLWMGHYHPFSMHMLNYQTYQTATFSVTVHFCFL